LNTHSETTFMFAHKSLRQYLAANVAATSDKDLLGPLDASRFGHDWHGFLMFYFPLVARLRKPHHLQPKFREMKGEKMETVLSLLQHSNCFASADFTDAHMCSEDVGRIVGALRGSPTLLMLGLSGNRLVGAGVEALAKAIRENPSITHLDLQRSDLLPQCVERLAGGLRWNTKIKKLHLGENFIGEAGAWHLAQMLQVNSTLEDLDLRSNDIEKAGGRFFGKMIEVNSTLKRLCLRYNYLGPEGACWLRGGLALLELDLQGNGIGPSGLSSISSSLMQSNALTDLNVTGCSTGDDGALSIGNMLQHPCCKLRALSMAANFITGAGARSLAAGLTGTTLLRVLDLSRNLLPESAVNEITLLWTNLDRGTVALDLSGQQAAEGAVACTARGGAEAPSEDDHDNDSSSNSMPETPATSLPGCSTFYTASFDTC